jgi:glycerol transport system ATP-binding protein
VTHDQTEALTFADTGGGHVSKGEVVQIGTPADLFERPARHFVGYFIGSPGMNVMPADLRAHHAPIGAARDSSCERAVGRNRRHSCETRRAAGYVRLSSGEGRRSPLPYSASRISAADKIARVQPRGASTGNVVASRRRAQSRATAARSLVPAAGHVQLYADGLCRVELASLGHGQDLEQQGLGFMVLPVLVLVAFNAIIPLMTVVNYSVQETFGDNVFFFEA